MNFLLFLGGVDLTRLDLGDEFLDVHFAREVTDCVDVIRILAKNYCLFKLID